MTRRGRFVDHRTLWRTLSSLLSGLAGLAVVIVVAGALGRWSGPAVLGWLFIAPLLLTRAGERVVLRVGCGHRRTRVPVDHFNCQSVRCGPATAWLTAPWRATRFVFGAVLRRIARDMPAAKSALLLMPLVLVVAGVQLVQQREWVPLVVLAALVLLVAVEPVLDTAVSGTSRLGVDSHTAEIGIGAVETIR